MSEAILDQQDIKNMEAAQTMEEQLDKATKEAEDAHTAYFNTRHTDPNYDFKKESKLWHDYVSAHNDEMDYLWQKMDKSSMYDVEIKNGEITVGIDPNDYQEDDKVPADPQEKDGNDASNY